MTPEFTDLAKQLRGQGQSWRAVVQELVSLGAARLDLVRAVRDVQGVGIGEAHRILNECGAVAPVHPTLTIVFDENDADDIFGPLQ